MSPTRAAGGMVSPIVPDSRSLIVELSHPGLGCLVRPVAGPLAFAGHALDVGGVLTAASRGLAPALAIGGALRVARVAGPRLGLVLAAAHFRLRPVLDPLRLANLA